MSLTINEQIRGFLYGTAIGDALGLGTEFMTRSEVKMYYPDGLHDYSQIIKDGHRAQWERGVWTNDTTVVLMAVESMIACDGPDLTDYARRLKEWYQTDPTDLLSHLRWVLSQDNYLDDPVACCRRVWREMRRFEGSNESLGRGAAIGLWPGDQTEAAIGNSRLTHADSRCSACSALMAHTSNNILWNNRIIGFDEAVEVTSRYDDTIVPYLEKALGDSLDPFELDDEDSYWYTRKCVGVAMWVLWHDIHPRQALDLIIEQGGDADTNASLGVCLAGLRYGIDDIPQNLIDGLVEGEKIARLADELSAELEKAGSR